MMSLRLPLGRLFHVGGNSETMLSQTVPRCRQNYQAVFRRWLVRARGQNGLVFFQLPVIRGTCALAWTVMPSLLTIAILIGPANPSALA